MSTVSTHVLDAVCGSPATGLAVTLADADGASISARTTDSDGRVADLAADVAPGIYRITFDTGAWFAANDVTGFYPEITICFEIVDGDAHHHVPVLLSPFAFSTYRGS